MISKEKVGLYILKVINLEKKVLELQNKMEENFIHSAMYFDLGLKLDKETIEASDKVGAELNQTITDLRYYRMLITESEDFCYSMN